MWDNCPTGYERKNQICFNLLAEALSFEEAMTKCKNDLHFSPWWRSRLAEPRTDLSSEYVWQLIDQQLPQLSPPLRMPIFSHILLQKYFSVSSNKRLYGQTMK